MINFKTIDANIKAFGKLLKTHAPEIMTGVGIILGGVTVVLAVKETPKALDKIKSDSKKVHDGDENAYTKVEAVKSAWKYYIPAAVTGVASVSLIVGAGVVNAKRVASLGTAYVLTKDAYNEYKDKVKEIVGEKKADEVETKISEDKVKAVPVADILACPGSGDTIFLEPYSGRPFKSTWRKLSDVQNQMNNEMIHTGSINLNDFYYLVGLESNKIGDMLGWHIDKNNIIHFMYDSVLSGELDDDGTRVPIVTLKFDCEPIVECPCY